MNKLIPFMVRQAHHERNQQFAVRPELVEGLVQSFLKLIIAVTAISMKFFRRSINNKFSYNVLLNSP